MRRSNSSESPPSTDVEYLLDVVDRDALDEEYQALHPKPWMTISPSGAIQYFDTEEQACEAQREAGPAYTEVPADIQADLAKIFGRLSELGYKAFRLSFQEFGADASCSILLSETEVLGTEQYGSDEWRKHRDIEIGGLSDSGVKKLEEALYGLGERIADQIYPGSSEWREGRLLTLEGLLVDDVAGVRVELQQPVERDEYRPFVLEDQSEQLKARVSGVVSALRDAGVASLQASYDGGGDEGDFEEIDLFDAAGDSLDEEAEEALADALGEDGVADALWPVLLDFAGEWEANNGAHGEMTINASGDVSIDHYDREDALDSIKVVNWRVEAGGAPQVQLDAVPEM